MKVPCLASPGNHGQLGVRAAKIPQKILPMVAPQQHQPENAPMVMNHKNNRIRHGTLLFFWRMASFFSRCSAKRFVVNICATTGFHRF